jgi:phospholipid/cholesterol/gamma-HCH transport system substrate-binding protein
VETLGRNAGLHPRWWTLILIGVLVAIVFVTMTRFFGTFRGGVPVTLSSDRAGLVMEAGGKVKMRGVPVGRVTQIQGGGDPVRLRLEIDPDQIRFIPANVEARIRASTVFGAKYVELIEPSDPNPRRLAAGAVIRSENVSTEVNTVFQNLTEVLSKIDPTKLNAVLTAVAEGLRGQGSAIGEATTDAHQVLQAVNPRMHTVRRDLKSLKGFSDTYGSAAQNIIKILDSSATTSTTITKNAKDLDALLTSVIGFSRSGVDLIGPNRNNLIKAINILEPATRLLMKYNPELRCLITGGYWLLDKGEGYGPSGGANGKSLIVDAALLLGDDPYRYPDNLPIYGAKGGPGGKPGCGSLPVVDDNWPVRYLVTNTGWGTGLDLRPNPGIGFPGYADYLPTTRGTPKAPSVRYPGGPAPGPIPYPGAPPYGAPQYGPDGRPLYPGLPPAPPPGAPREADPPPPGAEPFVPPIPMVLPPTPVAQPPISAKPPP